MFDELDRDYQIVEAEYPHIAKALKLLRGYPETAQYVEKILSETRNGSRQGFSPKVGDALINIQVAHKRLVKDSGPPDSLWGDSRDFFR